MRATVSATAWRMAGSAARSGLWSVISAARYGAPSPTRHAWAISGLAPTSSDSIGAGALLCPSLVMISSLRRPARSSRPCSSSRPRSPVRIQPSALNMAAVSFGRLR